MGNFANRRQTGILSTSSSVHFLGAGWIMIMTRSYASTHYRLRWHHLLNRKCPGAAKENH
jgi:hypothetical protein